ncbi:MAG: DNA repair protein RadC [Alphaproteobacteria bacterium]
MSQNPKETLRAGKANEAEADRQGHRERLRRRILEHGSSSLQDYELLEALLTYAVPRQDMKPIAKRLEKTYGSISGALRADPLKLQNVNGIGASSAALLQVVSEISKRDARSEIKDQEIVFSNWDHVRRYVRSIYKGAKKESLHILFLDGQNRLIADEVASQGTIDRTTVYVREILERALHYAASSIILVHNHPSGDLTPSEEDLDMTRSIQEALRHVEISLHDHLIVGRGGEVAGLKDLGLL